MSEKNNSNLIFYCKDGKFLPSVQSVRVWNKLPYDDEPQLQNATQFKWITLIFSLIHMYLDTATTSAYIHKTKVLRNHLCHWVLQFQSHWESGRCYRSILVPQCNPQDPKNLLPVTQWQKLPPPRGPVYNGECTQYKVVDTRQIDPNITHCDLQHKLPLCCKSISIDISNTELHLLIIWSISKSAV